MRHWLPLGEHMFETQRRRRSFEVLLEGDPDHGDTKDLIAIDIRSKESLQPPIEVLTISLCDVYWTPSLASDVEAASPLSLFCTEVRRVVPGIPHWEKSEIFFPGQGLTGPPTYSRMAISMDSLLVNGTRNHATFLAVTGMYNLCHLFVFPPSDLLVFFENHSQYMDALIILLGALDILDTLYLPGHVGLFRTEDTEDIYGAFTKRISAPRVIYNLHA